MSRQSAAWRGPLTHSQMVQFLDHFELAREDRARRNQVVLCELPKPVRKQDAVSAVYSLVRRHESLSTSYHIGSDGLPCQEVAASPEPSLIIWEDPPDHEECIRSLASRDFMLSEPPVAVGLLMRGSLVTTIVIATHHIALDGIGCAVLRADMLDLLGRRRVDTTTARPRDIASSEQSAVGRERSDKALSYIRAQLESAPNRVFVGRDGRSEVVEAYRVSTELAERLPGFAARARVTPAEAVLGAAGIALAAVSGCRTPAVEVLCPNRMTSERLRFAGCLFQPVLVMLDFTRPSDVFTAVAETARTMRTAFAVGAYDFAEMRETTAKVGLHRGVEVRPGVVFNVQSERSVSEPGWGHDEVRWRRPAWTTFDLSLDVRITFSTDGCRLVVTGRTPCVSAPDVESFILQIEGIIVSGQLPEFPTAPLPTVDNCWVDYARIRDVIGDHPSVESVEMGMVNDRVFATIRSRSSVLTPEAVRRHVLDRTAGARSVVCPQIITVQSDDACRADGREREWPDPLAALVRAAVSANGRSFHGDPAMSYVEQGGRVALLPYVQELTRAAGYEPPSIYELSSIRSIRHVVTASPTGRFPVPTPHALPR